MVSLTMRSENGTFAVPFASQTGRGTNWLKNGMGGNPKWTDFPKIFTI